MDDFAPHQPVPDLISQAGQRLTSTERQIAAAVLEDRTLLAFGTVTDLAVRVGTSRPSIVRFATKLGFGGYSELQEHARRDLSRQLSRPIERIRHTDSTEAAARSAFSAALDSVFDAMSGGRLAALAVPVIQARNVWILSGETSQAGAHALHSGLTIIRPAVHLIEERSSARALVSASAGDALVVFDFPRYRRHSITVARALAELGVNLVAFTDGPLSPLAALTDTWCQLSIPAIGPFDSSVPSVAAAELLVAEVGRELHDTAMERIDRTETLWRQMGTFLP